MWGVLEDDRRPAHACHWGVTSVPALRPQSSAPASPQTPTAHPSEVSVLWARGTAQRLCPALGPHPRNAKTLPPPQRHPALRTRGHQGLPCLLLYCLCVRSPPTLSVSFVSSLLSFPPAPAPTPEFSTGKRVTPPSLPPGSPTHSCFLLFYFHVCIIYFFLPPLFCPPSSLFCHVTGGCAMSLQTAGLSGCLVLQCSTSSSLPTFSFLQCFLRAVSTIWKLERN